MRPIAAPVKHGMTLVEFLVAGAILLMVATISVAFLRQSGPTNILQNAARLIVTDLRYGSELAVATQINHAIRFDPPRNQYQLIALENPERLIKTVVLDQSLALIENTLPNATVEFNVLGAAVQTGNITLINRNSSRLTLDIRPSGYVQIR